MKVSLLGQFGSGNSGNDGSLEAMLAYLIAFRPDAELLCICSNPALVTEKHKIASISVGGPAPNTPLSKVLDKALMKIPRRIALLARALAYFGGVDLLIIPGTGILDDFQETAFGWPFVLFCWCFVARLRHTEIAFISVGAGPVSGRLSRWFLRCAAKMASYRSYRDDFSLEFMRTIGVDVSKDHRHPDITFMLPTPTETGFIAPGRSLTVGVGVMQYRGWRRNESNAQAIYCSYITKISALVDWLVGQGHDVRLLMGDLADRHACQDVLQRLASSKSKAAPGRVTIEDSDTLHDIIRQISAIDVAIVTRYHNLVCSLKLDKPCISIGYAKKNDDLMQAFGQSKYCQHIETFEIKEIIELIQDIIFNKAALNIKLFEKNLEIKSEIITQQECLQTYLKKW